jgi:hypothetical protein
MSATVGAGGLGIIMNLMEPSLSPEALAPGWRTRRGGAIQFLPDRYGSQIYHLLPVHLGNQRVPCTINAAMVEVNSAMVQCSGVLKANTVQANTVLGATYTPGSR